MRIKRPEIFYAYNFHFTRVIVWMRTKWNQNPKQKLEWKRQNHSIGATDLKSTWKLRRYSPLITKPWVSIVRRHTAGPHIWTSTTTKHKLPANGLQCSVLVERKWRPGPSNEILTWKLNNRNINPFGAVILQIE